ncbi:unnamed protein product [Ectocarpus sp. 12 AP-2014]
MQDELQRLQVQVSDKYRSSAESASEQLRLMKEAQLLQDQLKHSNERLEKLQVEHGVSMSRCTTLEDENALSESALASLRAETESLRNMLGGREAEAVVLREEARKEREELMSRLLKDKERMLEEMNKMNEENSTLRQDKKDLAAKLQQQEKGIQDTTTAAQARRRATRSVILLVLCWIYFVMSHRFAQVYVLLLSWTLSDEMLIFLRQLLLLWPRLASNLLVECAVRHLNVAHHIGSVGISIHLSRGNERKR